MWVIVFLLLFLLSKANYSQSDAPKIKYSGDGLYYALTESNDRYNWYASIYFVKDNNGENKIIWYHLAIPSDDEIERVIYLAMTEEGLKNLSGEKYSGSYEFINEDGKKKIRIDANKMIGGGLFGDDSFVARTFIVEIANNSNKLIGKYLAKSWDHFPLTDGESKDRDNLEDFIDVGKIDFIFLED